MDKKIYRVPVWALGYITLLEFTSLNKAQIQMIEQWKAENGINSCDVTVEVISDQPYFSSNPEFGDPCLVYDCVKYIWYEGVVYGIEGRNDETGED